jgi:hypothetical protein
VTDGTSRSSNPTMLITQPILSGQHILCQKHHHHQQPAQQATGPAVRNGALTLTGPPTSQSAPKPAVGTTANARCVDYEKPPKRITERSTIHAETTTGVVGDPKSARLT